MAVNDVLRTVSKMQNILVSVQFSCYLRRELVNLKLFVQMITHVHICCKVLRHFLRNGLFHCNELINIRKIEVAQTRCESGDGPGAVKHGQ